MGFPVTDSPTKTPAVPRGTSVKDETGVAVKLMTETWNTRTALEEPRPGVPWTSKGEEFDQGVSNALQALVAGHLGGRQ